MHSQEMPQYKVYALKYAETVKQPDEIFIGGVQPDDPHDVWPMDYFIWAVVGAQRSFVVDSGMTRGQAEIRGRTYLRTPGEALGLIGIDAAQIQDVILTHLHYDHAGGLDDFPGATIHVQDRELAFATGRHMCHPHIRLPFDVEDAVRMVRNVYAGRVRFHDGVATLAPGVSVHHVGGHSAGLQVVRVWTRKGWMVVASDASHFYANMDQGRPFPIVWNAGDTLEGYATARALADDPAHVIPGHDPLVLKRFPAAKPELEGMVARLD